MKKLTFFQNNRLYLLSSLILGLLLPLVAPLIMIEKPEAFIITFDEFQVVNTAVSSVSEEKTDWHSIANMASLMVYMLGVAFMFLRLSYGLTRIYTLFRGAEKVRKGNLIFAYNDKPHLPFSFMNVIFLSRGVDFGDKLNKVIVHEIAHVKQWHSIDVLIIEILQVFFWFNPVLIFYKKSLKDAHEFIADRTVITTSDFRDYVQLLLHTGTGSLEGHLVNSFFNSQIKNRITMLHTKHSNPRATLRYIILIPMIGLFTYILASNKMVGEFYQENIAKINNDSIFQPIVPLPSIPSDAKWKDNVSASSPKDTTAPSTTMKEEVFMIAEEMPRFPGCEGMEGSVKEKHECSKEKLLQYLGENVKYPQPAKENGIGGVAIIQFIVTKNGEIKDVLVLRDPGSGLGQAAKEAVESMNAMSEKWISGRQRGVPVNVQYTVPIKFKSNNTNTPVKMEQHLPAGSGALPAPPPPPPTAKHEIFKIVQEMPRFPGCEDPRSSIEEKDLCAKEKLMAYIGRNISYNAEARKNGVEGTAIVQFTITKKGDIEDVVVLRDPGSGLGEDAKKVISSMKEMSAKWIPGKQRGVYVDVQYTVPVKFMLNSSKTENEAKSSENQVVVVGHTLKKTDQKSASGSENEKKETLAKQNVMVDKNGLKPLYIIDGKKAEESQLNRINPSDILTIDVHKSTEALVNYTNHPELYGGLILVTTKNAKKTQEKSSINKYFIDGKLSDQKEVSNIKPGDIEIMEVVKGKGKNEGAVFIKTKGSRNNDNLNLTVVPNPAPRDRLNIDIRSNSDFNPVILKVYDAVGKLIHTQSVDVPNGKGSAEINLTGKLTSATQVLIVAEQGKNAEIVKAVISN